LAVEVCSAFFLAIYTVELSLRFYAYGVRKALVSRWVRFDAFLVCGGFLDLLIKLIMNGQSNEVLEKLMLVRMLRLARLARAARLMVQFKVLWQLVHGLMSSLLTVLWTFTLIVALVYIFAIMGMEFIRPDEEAGEEYQAAAIYFEDLGGTMLTLIQFVTMDSIGAIYRPLTIAKPSLIIYFSLFLLLVSVALMNLVTAIIVDHAVQQSHSTMQQRDFETSPASSKAFTYTAALVTVGAATTSLSHLSSCTVNSPKLMKSSIRMVAPGRSELKQPARSPARCLSATSFLRSSV